MSTLTFSLLVMMGVWLGFRLGLWWSRRSLETVIEADVAKRGFRPSPEFTALLRRPTVDGVARRLLRKRGLCSYADVMLLGETITLVCHDGRLLQRACNAIAKLKADLQLEMAQASQDAREIATGVKVSTAPEFHAPPLPEKPASTEPFSVIDGGVK
jgi:hypothetical protein